MRMNATRSVPLTNGGIEQHAIFVYWFIGKNRLTARHWQRILWTARDRVLHNTNHRWAYIMISESVAGDAAQTGNGKSPEEAMQAVTRFVRDVFPTLVEK